MAEYIDREALMKHACVGMARVSDTEWQKGYWGGVDDMAEYIREQPAADVVEVVRCKDCKYFVKYKCRADGGIERMMCSLVNGTYDENWYCADGAKMDGKGESE